MRLLVYDTERGLWHEEDVCSCEMASTGGQLYLWDGSALWAADPGRKAAGFVLTGGMPVRGCRTSPRRR